VTRTARGEPGWVAHGPATPGQHGGYNGRVAEDLATEIKIFARQVLGFQLVGVTTAEPLPGAAHLARWLAAGAHGDMRYMAETAPLRGDPGAFLAGTKSVVCVAMSYHTAPDAGKGGREEARAIVAHYAQRKDYHKVIKARLTRLGRFIAERVHGARWRSAVDTAPVLEKELAQRAGLGWIGKNTCLINRVLGSELLLGELFTTVELPADEPESDHCGTCSACLDSCPTKAFAAPRQLDARLCISYLTIEHRGPLPRYPLPLLGNHLFGCDICQTVCPWNRRAAPSCAPSLATRPHLQRLTRGALEALDAEQWLSLSAGTPLCRLDFTRLRRNLAAMADDERPANADPEV
jgi:epoxyqueuosine reductase